MGEWAWIDGEQGDPGPGHRPAPVPAVRGDHETGRGRTGGGVPVGPPVADGTGVPRLFPGVGPRRDHQRHLRQLRLRVEQLRRRAHRGRGLRRRLLPGRGPARPGGKGGPRRRVREGSLHPVPGRPPRGGCRPRRVLGGGGRRPEPVRLPLRTGGAFRPSPCTVRPGLLRFHRQSGRPPSPGRSAGRLRAAGRVPGPRRPDPPLPLQPSRRARASAPRPWPRRPPCARSPCACPTGS